MLLLCFGLDVQACDVAEELTYAIELVDSLGDAADGGERGDEVIHAVQVLHVRCLDDMAEENNEGDERGVKDRPIGFGCVRVGTEPPNTDIKPRGGVCAHDLPVKIPNLGEMA